MIVTLDIETRSSANLLKTGAWAYSCAADTEVICLSYRLGDLVAAWWPGQPVPGPLAEALEAGHPVEAHNVSFEIGIYENVLVPRHGFPPIPLEQWRDTMAVACYKSLPPSLEKLSRATGGPGKNPEGGRLITRYSKLHLPSAKKEIPLEDFGKWLKYCEDDVMEEYRISQLLGELPEQELDYFLFEIKMGWRGMRIDQEGVAAASEIVAARSKQLTAEFKALTGFNPYQTVETRKWLQANGLPDLPDLQAETIEKLLEEGDLPQGPARRALELRQRVTKASTKKLDSFRHQCGPDGRIRFQTRYHGARTGRNTGAGVQPLNLPRGIEGVDPDDLVRDIKLRNPEWLDMVYGDAMTAVAGATRHWIMADEGKTLVSGDFVSIEAVILACLAGEEWKVKAFRDGVKIYEAMADKIYNLPEGTVTKATHPKERQDGKTAELAFGYQGNVGAWLKFDRSGRHTDEDIRAICTKWREAHPATVAFWRDMETAAIEAVASPVTSPNKETECRGLRFQCKDGALTLRLLNGKLIWYQSPELKMQMPVWHKPFADCMDGCDCIPRLQLTYMAWQFGKWQRVYTYGGKLVENATQATAREYLMPAALEADRSGYPVILTLYDQIVSEIPVGTDIKRFEDIMLNTSRPWADNWPVRVDVWTGKRFRK